MLPERYLFFPVFKDKRQIDQTKIRLNTKSHQKDHRTNVIAITFFLRSIKHEVLASIYRGNIYFTRVTNFNKHNRLNVGRISLERLVGALINCSLLQSGGGGGGGGLNGTKKFYSGLQITTLEVNINHF